MRVLTRLRAQWRWWLVAAVAVVVVSAVGASSFDDTATLGPAGAAEEPSASRDDAGQNLAAAPGGLASRDLDDADSTAVETAESVSSSIDMPSTNEAASQPAGESGDIARRTGAATRADPSTSDVAGSEGDLEAPADLVAPSTNATGPTGDDLPLPSATSPAGSPSFRVPTPVTSPSASLPEIPSVITSPQSTAPSPATPSVLIESLTLRSEASRTGYARQLFPHWIDLDGNGCDARQDTLGSQILGFPQRDLFDACVIVEGDWWSIYDDVYHAGSPSELDVDHVVALAEAWDSGAWAWSEARRAAFANDPRNLVAVTASSNRSKSDRDVGEWRPPHRQAWCFTARATAEVKAAYGLSVDTREASALTEMLATCTTTSPDPRSMSGIPTPIPTLPPPVASPGAAPSPEGITAPPSTEAPPPPAPVTTTPTSPPPTSPTETCVDINAASTSQLERIVHIGPSRAATIESLRPFSSVEDLVRVSGIGSSRLADILAQGLACVGS